MESEQQELLLPTDHNSLPFSSQPLADEVLLWEDFWGHCLASFPGIDIECGPGLQAALFGVESDLGSAA